MKKPYSYDNMLLTVFNSIINLLCILILAACEPQNTEDIWLHFSAGLQISAFN